MGNSKFAFIEFDPELNKKRNPKDLSKGLSAVLLIGQELWVANDETASIEKLCCKNESDDFNRIYCEHKEFNLDNYLSLPVPAEDSGKPEEIDIEGLDYREGYLWLVGSHSLKRSKPDNDKSAEKNIGRLAKVGSDGNRYLLARIPVKENNKTYNLSKQTGENGNIQTAAQLAGDANGNDLTEALKKDKHLQYFLTIPGKDNGFDIEGLAAGNNNHIFLGLRGPVLRGWAIILELELTTSNEDPSLLQMKNINPVNPDNPTYHKHFLDLGGLGIRDLCLDGSDILILAGPTMSLDGPVSIFRWINGAIQENGERFVWCDDETLVKLTDVAYGEREDHAEGMTPVSMRNGKISSVLVVYDSASEKRQREPCTIIGDIFDLPE